MVSSTLIFVACIPALACVSLFSSPVAALSSCCSVPVAASAQPGGAVSQSSKNGVGSGAAGPSSGPGTSSFSSSLPASSSDAVAGGVGGVATVRECRRDTALARTSRAAKDTRLAFGPARSDRGGALSAAPGGGDVRPGHVFARRRYALVGGLTAWMKAHSATSAACLCRASCARAGGGAATVPLCVRRRR